MAKTDPLPTPTPAEVVLSLPEQIQATIYRKQALLDAEIAEHKRELEAANAILHPQNQRIDEYRVAVERIASAEKSLAVQQERADRYRECIRSRISNPEAIANFWMFHQNDPALPIAREIATEIEAWLVERRAELPALLAEIHGYAVKNELTHLLPADLKPAV